MALFYSLAPGREKSGEAERGRERVMFSLRLHIAQQLHCRYHRQRGEEQAADDEADTDEPIGADFAREQDEVDGEHMETAETEGGVINVACPFEELLRVPAGERREAEHGVAADSAEVEETDAVRFPASNEGDGGPTQVEPAAQG